MADVQSYNLTIGEESALYEYYPGRDLDPALGWNSSYTGNIVYDFGAVGTGTPYRTTQVVTTPSAKNYATVSLSFQGTAIYMCFSAIAEADAHAVPVCSQWGGTTIAFVNDLPAGNHTAVLAAVSYVTGGHAFNFFGSVVTLTIPEGTGVPSPLAIDDTAYGWTYSPANEWSQVVDPGAVNGSFSQTCYYNGQSISSATYTATNVLALYVVGVVKADISFYTVQMNEDPPYVRNAYNFWTSKQQILFLASDLDPMQQYTIQIQNYAAQYPSPALGNDQSCLRVDAIYLFSANSAVTSNDTTASTTSTASTSNTTSATHNTSPSGASSISKASSSSPPVGVIAGSVIGGLAIITILVLALALLVWLRRRNRSQLVDLLAGKPDDASPHDLGPDTVPIPYFDDNAEVPVQPSNATIVTAGEGDGSVFRTSLSSPAAPPSSWSGQDKTSSATYNFGYTGGFAMTPFIPPSTSLFASNSTSRPAADAAVIDDPPAGAGDLETVLPAPLSSAGHSTELPTYDSIHAATASSR
ncbi:hypothetical protein CALCODRAFT_519223 [Calocera cornea HHB12733]|uniref:Transmembrane protein n=1 Tax=Calocera cornea HHB12733 TaxID=1353952 RepID=A0A165EDE8_9BASI|nr:hypothetical protein CALCODRAFT_519223 [Calocera cornea HHB12733]